PGLDDVHLALPDHVDALPDVALPDDRLPGLVALLLYAVGLSDVDVRDVAPDDRRHEPVRDDAQHHLPARREGEEGEPPEDPREPALQAEAFEVVDGAVVPERGGVAEAGEAVRLELLAADRAEDVAADVPAAGHRVDRHLRARAAVGV